MSDASPAASPLLAAAAAGDATAVAALLAATPERDAPAALDARDAAGNTPLHLAAASASPTAPAAVAALLSAGADADARNAARATPLMAHVRAAPRTPASTDVASLLLASGADVNAPDSTGFSPLLHACYEGKSPLVARFMAEDARADVAATYTDADGDVRSALQLARTPEIRHLLRGHAESPVCRRSARFAAASTGGTAAARGGDAPPRLLVERAVLKGADGTARAVALSTLPHATSRLAAGGDPPFAPEEPALPGDDAPSAEVEALEARLAAVALAADDDSPARAPPPPRGRVEQRALDALLLTPPGAWQPPAPGDKFCLTAPDILLLCDRAESQLRNERMVLRLQAPCKIFGDTHGQYGDLLRLFEAYGAPSATGDIFATGYLFIGDYVDRGLHQLETICLLLALKLAHPAEVHLLRGNHEVRSVNTNMHDFQRHCVARLGRVEGKAVHARLNDLFEMLPLAAVIEAPPSYVPDSLRAPLAPPPPPPVRVFCVHGGVGRLQRIEDLDALPRPLPLDADVASLAGAAAAAHLLAEDALWSDPAARDDDAALEAAGGAEDNTRGAGARFAPSAVRAFCARNGVAAVVRAHQVPRDGVELFAGGLGVTIFSAADYPETAAHCEREGNAAGLLWMGRDGRLYARLIKPLPRAPPPPLAPQTTMTQQ